jgi:predicted ATPase
MTLAQEQSHPYSVAVAHVMSSWLHQFLRKSKLTQELAERLIEISKEHGFPQWIALGNIMRGWAVVDQGLNGDGIDGVRDGIAARRVRGWEVALTYFLALLAESYCKVGNAKEGIAILTEALDTVDKNGERFYKSELYRLKGELLLSLSQENDNEAEGYLRQAMDIAHQQGAKSLELRASTSLSRLLKSKGKKDEAKQILVEIYNWFTEGFDTKDLKESKALLDELL